MDTQKEFAVIPMLALRGLTVFPNILMHFDVGRDKSIKALDEVMSKGQNIFLVSQRDIRTDAPDEEDVYKVGTISTVRQILKLPGDNMRVLVEGVRRARINAILQREPYFMVEAEEFRIDENIKNYKRAQALIRQTCEVFKEYIALAPRMTPEVLLNVLAIENPGHLADYIAQNIAIRNYDKQAILEELQPNRRIVKLMGILKDEIAILEMEQEINNKLHGKINKNQREYYLKEQIKVIQNELGEGDDAYAESGEYRERILKLNLPQESQGKLLKEAGRLARLQFNSPEGAVIRTYLDTCLELPWNKKTKERVDIDAAQKILEKDHFGLEKVKERILEYLAVKRLNPSMKGQILCFIGPPGVGKTSVASSVAKAMNRKMSRISLGGVRDEADIRGHRKTYIGAMAGRIINGVKLANSKNALLLLDEIDKMGHDFRGDPAAALLEVLDSEQNHSFRDHYIEIPFDLSDVIFITTANTAETIPRALLDRMEIITLTGYTDEEKLQIMKRHLLPKQMKNHGLSKAVLKISDDAMREVIACYTKEAGVRRVERELSKICRKTAKKIAANEAKSVSIGALNVEEYLGPRKYKPEKMRPVDEVGIATGLAWTAAGGDILDVEVNVVPGSGKIELTGNLGDVMKESARAALSYIRSRAASFQIDPDFHKNCDIHIHFPEGAIPKDGPSAGITMAVALVSALSNSPVRRDIAMTGEITLRGRVLPIGGLKEKTMAAFRAGIKTVIIPAENESDLSEIDQTVKNALNFITAGHMDAVLKASIDFSARNVTQSAEKTVVDTAIPIDMNKQPDVLNSRFPT